VISFSVGDGFWRSACIDWPRWPAESVRPRSVVALDHQGNRHLSKNAPLSP